MPVEADHDREVSLLVYFYLHKSDAIHDLCTFDSPDRKCKKLEPFHLGCVEDAKLLASPQESEATSGWLGLCSLDVPASCILLKDDTLLSGSDSLVEATELLAIAPVSRLLQNDSAGRCCVCP